VTKLERGYIMAYINLALALCSIILLLSLLIIMLSLHELCDMPVKGDYFLTFDDLLKVICDASVKHKFSFKVPHRDIKRARYRCTNKAYLWLVNAHLNPENENEIIIDKVVLDHSYIGDA
jgi:hypothetical protein